MKKINISTNLIKFKKLILRCISLFLNLIKVLFLLFIKKIVQPAFAKLLIIPNAIKENARELTLVTIFAILLFVDSLNFREYYQRNSTFDGIQNNFEIYYINIELWVTLFASIFAVLGTYFFTRIENTKSLKAQKKLSSTQSLNNLTLLSSTEYLLKETIRTYDAINVPVPQYLAFPVNKIDFPYLSLMKEINIINNVLSEHNIDFTLTSDSVLYKPFNDNDIIFQATINLEPLQKITYVNPEFFENLHALSLYDLIGFNTRTATLQYIDENKSSIIARLDSLQRLYKPDYEGTLQNNIDSSTLRHVILMIEEEINNLLMSANENYIKFTSQPELASNYKPLVDSIKALNSLYFIKHSKYLNFIEHDQFENISLLNSDSKFFSSKNNCLLIVNIADIQQYFEIKNSDFD